MGQLRLDGCRCEPLASYLKSIGLLRLVAEQLDPLVRGAWHGDTFVLETHHTLQSLVDYIVDEYIPTPVVSAWNSGSGFGADDASKSPAAFEAMSRIRVSTSPRLEPFRQTIEALLALTRRDGWSTLDKAEQVALCRGSVPDRCVEWIDAAVVITSDSREFPPLLGTGGNDGRLDFGSNFMQRLVEVLGLDAQRMAEASVRALAYDALCGTSTARLETIAIGQFDPAAAGGQRSAPGGAATSLANPWDFILLFEGAAAFASGVARRFGGAGSRSAMPFTVGSVAAAYGSAADENSRGEFWAPVWRQPSSAPEVLRLIAEGRAEYGGRQARTAVDAARALGSLGVDRGIDEFVRFGFLERNGLSTFCVPLARLKVGQHGAVGVLGDLDRWVDSVRRVSKRPASISALLRSVDGLNIAISQNGRPDQLQELLSDVGELERRVRSSGSVNEKALRWTGVDAGRWLPLLDDGSTEFGVAVSLASLRSTGARFGWLRRLFAPEGSGSNRPFVDGFGQRDLRSVLADCLTQIIVRSSIDGADRTTSWCGAASAIWCRDDDYVDFTIGQCDDRRIEHLLKGLVLLDWSRCDWRPDHRPFRPAILNRVPASLAMLKPLFHHRGIASAAGLSRPLVPTSSIGRLLAADQVAGVLRVAARDLRVAGCQPFVDTENIGVQHPGPWLSAAALVPTSDSTAVRLLRRITVTSNPNKQEGIE